VTLEPKFTGLRCLSCRKDVAVVEANSPPVIVMRCPACGHLWKAAEPGAEKH